MESFEAYDFDGDEKWQSILDNLVITTSSGSDAAIRRRRMKYFKKHVDPEFEIPSNPTQPPPQHTQPPPQHTQPPPSYSNVPTASPWVVYLHVGILFCFAMTTLPSLFFPAFSRVCYQLVIFGSFLSGYMAANFYGIKLAFSRDALARFIHVEEIQVAFGLLALLTAQQMAVFLFPAVAHSLVYLCRNGDGLVQRFVSSYYSFLKPHMDMVKANADEFFQFGAMCDVLTGFYLVFSLFFPFRSIMALILHWQILRLKVMINYRTLTAFRTVKGFTDRYLLHPYCPSIIQSIYTKVVAMMQSAGTPPTQ